MKVEKVRREGGNKKAMRAIYTGSNVAIPALFLVEGLQNNNLAWKFKKMWLG